MATIARPGTEVSAFESPPRFSPITRNPCQVLARRNRVTVFLGRRRIGPVSRGGHGHRHASRRRLKRADARVSRTGRIARSLQDGKLCHYVIFDNKTAIAIEDRIGRCDEDKPKPKKERPAMFSWGK